jgi:hypothetical protein
MSSRHCPIQRLCYISIDRAAAPPNHRAVAPYRSVAGIQCWVCNCDGSFPCLRQWNKTHKKRREIWGVLALGGHHLVKKSNNQPIVGRNGARDDGEGARLGRIVRGVLSICAEQQIEQCKKYKSKICCSLRWPCYDISHATTNQKHEGTMERVNKSRCN